MEKSQSSLMVTTKALKNHIQMNLIQDEIRTGVLTTVLAVGKKNRAELSNASESLSLHTKALRDAAAQNGHLLLDEEITRSLQVSNVLLEEYIQTAEETISLFERNADSGKVLLHRLNEKFKSLEASMADLEAQIVTSLRKPESNSVAIAATVCQTIIVLACIGAVVTSMAGITIVRAITKPMNELIAHADKISGTIGEMAAVVHGQGRTMEKAASSVGQAMKPFKQFADNFKRASDVLKTLNNSGEVIGSIVVAIKGRAEQTNLFAPMLRFKLLGQEMSLLAFSKTR